MISIDAQKRHGLKIANDVADKLVSALPPCGQLIWRLLRSSKPAATGGRMNSSWLLPGIPICSPCSIAASVTSAYHSHPGETTARVKWIADRGYKIETIIAVENKGL